MQNPYLDKKTWEALSPSKKIQYIFHYFKLPIFIAFVILYILGYSIYGHFTQKNTLLHIACINVAPSEELKTALSEDFFRTLPTASSKDQLQFYTGWYLTDNPNSQYYEYTYASQMKILAAIDGEQLDVVFLNQEAFDAFAQNGYLYNLEILLEDSEEAHRLQPFLVENMEILEDNAKEVRYDPSVEYQSKTTRYPMALDVSEAPLFQHAGFQEPVYLGVIANTPRPDLACAYIQYLFPSQEAAPE